MSSDLSAEDLQPKSVVLSSQASAIIAGMELETAPSPTWTERFINSAELLPFGIVAPSLPRLYYSPWEIMVKEQLAQHNAALALANQNPEAAAAHETTQALIEARETVQYTEERIKDAKRELKQARKHLKQDRKRMAKHEEALANSLGGGSAAAALMEQLTGNEGRTPHTFQQSDVDNYAAVRAAFNLDEDS